MERLGETVGTVLPLNHLNGAQRLNDLNESQVIWAAEVGGDSWRVRINDFPDELMYSLMIGSENAGDFHDWPETLATEQRFPK
jgi:hypothetical protein